MTSVHILMLDIDDYDARPEVVAVFASYDGAHDYALSHIPDEHIADYFGYRGSEARVENFSDGKAYIKRYDEILGHYFIVEVEVKP